MRRNHRMKIKTIGNVDKTPEIQKLEMNLTELEKGGYRSFHVERNI